MTKNKKRQKNDQKSSNFIRPKWMRPSLRRELMGFDKILIGQVLNIINLIGLLDSIIRYGQLDGQDRIILDKIIGQDYWIGLLDWIIGWFFFTQTLTWPAVHSSQGRFVVLFFRILVQKGHIWSKKVISGPDFLKSDDIWSNFIKLDQIGSTLFNPWWIPIPFAQK